jgi:hypothetical protein
MLSRAGSAQTYRPRTISSPIEGTEYAAMGAPRPGRTTKAPARPALPAWPPASRDRPRGRDAAAVVVWKADFALNHGAGEHRAPSYDER